MQPHSGASNSSPEPAVRNSWVDTVLLRQQEQSQWNRQLSPPQDQEADLSGRDHLDWFVVTVRLRAVCGVLMKLQKVIRT